MHIIEGTSSRGEAGQEKIERRKDPVRIRKRLVVVCWCVPVVIASVWKVGYVGRQYMMEKEHTNDSAGIGTVILT